MKREKSRSDLPTGRFSGQGDAFGASMSGCLVELMTQRLSFRRGWQSQRTDTNEVWTYRLLFYQF
jgi:hypothetical protein